MSNVEKPVEELFFESGMGKYDVTKLAIEWIKVKKNEEEYRNLSQKDLLDRAIKDVVTGIATYKEIENIRKKKFSKEDNEEDSSAN
ncbi:MAG: hypothetical protein II816_07175 [Elusimicrobia bacterium]|nr:hypothetical protein [Elusimicrobiota bacterium]